MAKNKTVSLETYKRLARKCKSIVEAAEVVADDDRKIRALNQQEINELNASAARNAERLLAIKAAAWDDGRYVRRLETALATARGLLVSAMTSMVAAPAEARTRARIEAFILRPDLNEGVWTSQGPTGVEALFTKQAESSFTVDKAQAVGN